MLPKTHIILGLIFSIFLYFIFSITISQAMLVFLASVFIDVDHYLVEVLKTKNISIKKAYKTHINLPKKHKPFMHIFHTIEFLIFVTLLFFLIKIPIVSQFIFFILIGLLFHSSLDLIDMAYNNKWGCREFSLTRYLLLKNKHPRKYLN